MKTLVYSYKRFILVITFLILTAAVSISSAQESPDDTFPPSSLLGIDPSIQSAVPQADLLPLPGTSRLAPRDFAPSQQITIPSAAVDDLAGYSVAIDGDLIAVGAPLHDTNRGRAFLYQRESNGNWTLLKELLIKGINQPADNYGYDVALFGNTAFVSAATRDAGRGVVFVFRPNAAGNWLQVQKLQPTLPEDAAFGAQIQVDPSGERMVIAALGEGAAYVYELDALGDWVFEARLFVGPTVESAAIRGDTVLVGSYANGLPGKVYIFKFSSGSWLNVGNFSPTDGYADDAFGGRVTIHENFAYVIGNISGAPGAIYVFEETSGAWLQRQKLIPNDGAINDRFGISLAIQGETMAIGSYLDDTGQGSVYIFKRSGTNWVQDDKLTADGGNFGRQVDLDNTTLVVGAPAFNSNRGKVHVYDDPDLLPPPTEAELLVDGGFEADAADWEINGSTADKVKCNKTSKVYAHEGNCAWRFKGELGENASIGQTITDGTSNTTMLTLSGFVNASGTVNSKIKVVIKHVNPNIEKQKLTLNIVDTGGVYIPLSAIQPQLSAPVTAAIEQIKFSINNQGESGKVYYDALSLMAQ